MTLYEISRSCFLRHRFGYVIHYNRQSACERLEGSQSSEFRYHNICRSHQPFHLLGIAYDAHWETRRSGHFTHLFFKLAVSAGEKNSLHVEIGVDEVLEYLRYIASAHPACIDENGELFRVESKLLPHLFRRDRFNGHLKLR